jgi:putative tryptophan/tyrosine transport system substrate-binding protein
VKRRDACRGLLLLPLSLPSAAKAQPAGTLHLAWFSASATGPTSPSLEALRAGLRELGYVEGRNLVIDTWWGQGARELTKPMVRDLVAAKPAVIVAQGGASLTPLLEAGVKLPIVYGISADPVLMKVATSYARPGGNATGMSYLALEPLGKRMELLKEVVPGLKRVAVIANPQHPGEQREWAAAQDVVARLGLSARYFPVYTGAGLDAALADIAKARDQAIVAFADGFTMNYAGRIAEFSVKERIPAVSGWGEFALRGNILTYGPNLVECYRRLASYVDRIHKGANPGDLPIEQPTKLELVINLKTAQALGITIAPALLVRADEVIR